MKTMTRKEAEGILNEMMGVDLSTQAVSNDQPKRFPFPDMDAAMERIETLEAALRKVDEIRKQALSVYDVPSLVRILRALKAPCMEVYR